jgi:outer membrane lipoprotein LolB
MRVVTRAARRLAAAALAAGLVSACASLPPPQSSVKPTFEMSGRVAVRYGGESATGRAEWRHSPDADDMVISNPLGQGIAELTRRGGEYTLVTADGKRHTARDAEALTEEVLGWRLPLAGLPDWVQARPRPGEPAQTTLDGARLATLAQAGWRIEYLEYGENGLPRRLKLTRDTLDIRLVIEEWR